MKSIIVFILFLSIYFITPNISGHTDICSISVDTIYKKIKYFEYQVNLADSLYKNYLPQHNFDEVKNAMDFFESEVGNDELRTNDKRTKDNQSLIYNCARANYYHAVGLTELDDIVGACEHYLRVLELMEEEIYIIEKQITDFSKLSSSEYEKIKFIILTYTRLGNLFYNENYCDLAIVKFNKALIYSELIKDTFAQSHIYKVLGNTYQLYGKNDSALYYYNESIKTYFNPINKLDVEKSIATILYANGKKDSAYSILRNNLDKIENYGAKDSYYYVLGNMYYKDMEYDSAIIYLKQSVISPNRNIIIASSNCLSNIYDSLGEIENKDYYSNISIQHLIQNSNRNIDTSKIPTIYHEYTERKLKKEMLKNRELYILHLVLALVIIMGLICTYFITRHRYIEEILYKENEIDIKDKNIEEYKTINKDLHDYNEELIKISKKRTNKNNINNYRNCENCKKILTNIEYIKESNIKINNLNPLTTEELTMLLDDADIYLDNFIQKTSSKYPKLKKDDLYCICLLLLNISEPTIAVLLDKSYNTIWSRINKIRYITRIKSNINIYNIIK